MRDVMAYCSMPDRQANRREGPNPEL